MKLHRILLMAIGVATSAMPAFAGPNDPPQASPTLQPSLLNPTLGMALMGAAVNADGSTAHGGGVINAVKLNGLGVYQVQFDRDVQACVYTATVGPPGTGSITGIVSVALRAGTNSAVYVVTTDADGRAADKPFHLLVFCPR